MRRGSRGKVDVQKPHAKDECAIVFNDRGGFGYFCTKDAGAFDSATNMYTIDDTIKSKLYCLPEITGTNGVMSMKECFDRDNLNRSRLRHIKVVDDCYNVPINACFNKYDYGQVSDDVEHKFRRCEIDELKQCDGVPVNLGGGDGGGGDGGKTYVPYCSISHNEIENCMSTYDRRGNACEYKDERGRQRCISSKEEASSPRSGCMNPNALNYNVFATHDNGMCVDDIPANCEIREVNGRGNEMVRLLTCTQEDPPEKFNRCERIDGLFLHSSGRASLNGTGNYVVNCSLPPIEK